MTMANQRLHFGAEWRETHDHKCSACDSETVLVTARDWKTHPGGGDTPDEFVEVSDEVSGHYCPRCRRLTALWVNEGV